MVRPAPVQEALTAELPVIGSLVDVVAESHLSWRRADHPAFLAPVDLQVIKAAGVTLAASLVERMIKE